MVQIIKTFKDRVLEHGQRVSCFKNLHEDVFSIEGQAFERGKFRKLILAHGDGIVLKDVKFSVNEKNREKALSMRKRNIHAFAKGIFEGNSKNVSTDGMRQAYYNPLKQNYFSDKVTGEKIEKAECVVLEGSKIYYS